jgi:hypothetical protein
MQCSTMVVMYQKACSGGDCVGFDARRLLRGRTYGELAADFVTPQGWVPVSDKVRPGHGVNIAQACVRLLGIASSVHGRRSVHKSIHNQGHSPCARKQVPTCANQSAPM